ncbi:MAG: iron-containing alcohol dehydrogenase, partial [Chloroflexi bacterium]|nr:iron-containing alcohol dehydrogenase [Chloroflexota bacterium]
AAAEVEIVARVVSAGEPDSAAVMAASKAARDAGADVVIAVGGGSAMDLAKAAAVVDGDAQLAALLGGERLDEPRGLPVVALPTTGGSGAEVSHGAIVHDTATGRKRGIRGPGVAARVAIVDPELGAGVALEVTYAAGFDAIAHAIETAMSRAAGPITGILSADALPRLLSAVPRAAAKPDDLDARSSAAYAALLMGMNLATSTTCLPHRLQYPVGARTGTSHAQGVAALFPAWLERTSGVAPERLAGLALAAGLAPPDARTETAARALVDAVLGWLQGSGLPHRLGALGIRENDVDGLVEAVEGAVANDPGPVAPEDLRALYRASL